MAMNKDKLKARLASLQDQHAEQEQLLQTADPEEVGSIKRKKLRLKDEMETINRQLQGLPSGPIETTSPQERKGGTPDFEVRTIPGKSDFNVVRPPVAKSA